jgi:predicted Zn-dependent protease
MKRALAVLLTCAASSAAADDVVLRAMRDELARSMKKLQLETLQKPYFISYRAVETGGCTTVATFGALTANTCDPANASESRSRVLSVDVRVGDYARDNTNFFVPMNSAGVVRPLRDGGMAVPIEDNYDEIRRQLWLATDSAYKNALDLYAKKKAALENRRRTEDAPDFSKEPPVTNDEKTPAIEWNRAAFEKTVKTLSALFRETPVVADSEVRLNASHWLTRYVNSEGTAYTRDTSFATLQINAAAQAVDGMTLTDFDVVYGRTLDQLPSQEEMVKRVRAMGARLTNLQKAPMVEKYTGPVLFEGQAAAELFFQGLGSVLLGVPRVVVDDSRLESLYNSNAGLADRIGSRILPDFLSITDNASAVDFQDKPLFGGYQLDDEGVKAAPVTLVQNGILKTLLHSRALLPGTTQSTASKRGMYPSPSNLMISASKAMPPEQLKAELIRMAKQRGNEFGIVVRRVGNPSLAMALNRSVIIISTGGNAPGAIPLEPLIEAYKVFPDGHEELVRNLTVNGMTLASFKDIAAVSDNPYVYTAPMRISVRTPMMPTGMIAIGGPTAVSGVVPSMLFEELMLQRPAGDIPNLPFTTHPFFAK